MAAENDNDANLSADLRALVAEMRAERKAVSSLQQVVNRFVVAMERQLSAHDSAQRRAERMLGGMEPAKVEAMKARLAKAYRSK